ncbi:MAG: OmpA family protein, partial [Saprospiraceae bacterium]
APADNIEIKGLPTASSIMEGERLLSAVDFNFSEKRKDTLLVAIPPAVGEKERVWSTISYVTGGYGLQNANKNPKPMLDSLRHFLRTNRDKKVIINGYSEKSEEAKLPGNLAEKRAKAVRRYLVDTGVRRSQIEVKFTMQNAGDGEHSLVELVIE